MGLVQGLGEFLPISSTAHLILVPWFFGWNSELFSSLAFDVALHMGTLLALLIFVGLSAACWYGSVAVYRGTVGGPDPAASPDYHATAATVVGVTALTSFVPFPFGYLAGLFVWAVAAFGGLGLTARRAAILFAYLAASSFVARLVVLGYPRLFELTSSCGLLGMSLAKRTLLNGGADVLAEVVSARARAAGATFVDVRTVFAGHGLCGGSPWINGITTISDAFHPTATGYRSGYLAALTAAIG